MKEYTKFTWEDRDSRKKDMRQSLYELYSRDDKSFKKVTDRVSARKAKKILEESRVMRLMIDEIKVKNLGEYRIKLLNYRIIRNSRSDSSRFTVACRWGVCRHQKKGRAENHTCRFYMTRSYCDDVLDVIEDVPYDMYDVLGNVINEDTPTEK